MMKKIIWLSITLIAPLPAATITIPSFDRGWVEDNGGTGSNQNYLAGALIEGRQEWRNWFVFDLANVSDFQSATLRLELPIVDIGSSYRTDTNFEIYQVFQVETSPSSLLQRTGGLEVFDDLGTGINYGTVSVSQSDVGSFIEIPLNASAIRDAAEAQGLFAIGGAITSISPEEDVEDFVFGRTEDFHITQLVVVIPETTTTLSLVLASLGLFFRRIRK